MQHLALPWLRGAAPASRRSRRTARGRDRARQACTSYEALFLVPLRRIRSGVVLAGPLLWLRQRQQHRGDCQCRSCGIIGTAHSSAATSAALASRNCATPSARVLAEAASCARHRLERRAIASSSPSAALIICLAICDRDRAAPGDRRRPCLARAPAPRRVGAPRRRGRARSAVSAVDDLAGQRHAPAPAARRSGAPAAACRTSPGTMPSPVSGRPSLACASAMRRSAAAASSSPPPSAWPLSAAISGTRSRASASKTRWPARDPAPPHSSGASAAPGHDVAAGAERLAFAGQDGDARPRRRVDRVGGVGERVEHGRRRAR